VVFALRLKKFLAKELIAYRKSAESRERYVEPSKAGLQRFNDLAKAISIK